MTADSGAAAAEREHGRSAVVPSGQQFALFAGAHEVILVEVGGGIREYTVDRRRVLDGYAATEMRTGARGTPLIPWPNRIADGAYTFDGVDYQVALTEPEAHNAIHGFLGWRNWTVRDRDVDRVVLGTVLHPLQGYPFTLDVAIEYLVHVGAAAGSPAGLSVATTATNLGDTPCPYACGQHPYLTVGTEFINDATLALDAATWLPTDDRGLPIDREPVAAGSAFDYRTGRMIGETWLDYTFTDLARDGDGLAWARLSGPEGATVGLWVDEHYPFIELYTGDTQPPEKRRRGLGVEPMTCAPNAFRSGDGLIRLEPGQSITTRWGIQPG